MVFIDRILNSENNYFRNVFQNDIAAMCFCPYYVRKLIYKICGNKINGIVFPYCFLGTAKGRLILGENSYINYSCFLD